MTDTPILVSCDDASATFQIGTNEVELGAPSNGYGPMIVRRSTAAVSTDDLTMMRDIAGTACMLAAKGGDEPAGCAIRSAAFADLASFRKENERRVESEEQWFRDALRGRIGDFKSEVWKTYWQEVRYEERYDAEPSHDRGFFRQASN